MIRLTPWLCVVAEFLSVTVFGIAGAAAIGHAFGVKWLRHWIGVEGMAVNTSICFLLSSIATFLLSMMLRRNIDARPEAGLQLPPGTMFGFGPPDIIALLFVIGGFGAMALGKATDIIGILILIAGFYFGRTASQIKPKDEGVKEGKN